MYEYEATIYNVVDGDTLDLTLDLGFGVQFSHRFRLLDVDCPEINRGPLDQRELGLRAKKYVEDLVELNNKLCLVRTHKRKGKFGRYLANIYFEHNDYDLSLSALLIKEGHGVPYG
jgi:micrococcal nuclease